MGEQSELIHRHDVHCEFTEDKWNGWGYGQVTLGSKATVNVTDLE